MFSKLHILLFASLLSIVMCHLLVKRHIDFRQRFLQRRRQRQIIDQRIMLLDRYALRSTESINGIVHYKKIENGSERTKKIKDIEMDFRRLIAMKGVKYNYKRDLYWRTWRNVISTKGVDMYVCYKCNNPIQINVTGSQHCGMWTIEERPPPCPYEFFSVINDEKLCGANYTQYKDLKSSCPLEIKISDLTATCDNPIETVWRFTKLYGVKENYDKVICGGKDYCEVLTTYEMSPGQVIFRIINGTNDVMYSRIMKPNNTNYICVEDCGRFNPNTRTVAKKDQPLKLDLLTSRLNKRDGILIETIEGLRLSTLPTSEAKSDVSMSKNGGKIKIKKKMLTKRHQNTLDFLKNFVDLDILPKSTTISHCKKMQIAEEVSHEEQYQEYEY